MAKIDKETMSLHEYIKDIQDSSEKEEDKGQGKKEKEKTEVGWFEAILLHMDDCHLGNHIGTFVNPNIKIAVYSHTSKVAGYVTTGGSTCCLDCMSSSASYQPSAKLLLHTVPSDKNVSEVAIMKDEELEKELEKLFQPTEGLQEKVREMQKKIHDTQEKAQKIWENRWKEPEATDTHLRQVYFPVAEETYHLLSIMPSSSLTFEMYRRIRAINGHKIGCYKKRSETYGQPCEEITELTEIKFGGSQPQNISTLNSRYKGKVYLLSSLPPSLPARKIRLPKSDFFRESIWYKQQSNTLYRLHDYMKQNQNTMKIRQAIHNLVDEMISAVLLVSYQIRARGIGWSKEEAYSQLPTAQKIWLDDAYAEERKETSWADDISSSFARWVIRSYEKLLGEDAIKLGDAEHSFIKKQMENVLKDEVRYES